MGRYNEPKTRTRRRTVAIGPELAALIDELRPLVPHETDTLFPNTNGKPIEPKSFAQWYRCLRALKIRVRGAYAMKDTFVSLALMADGVNLQWLEHHTGVALPTLKTHYARFYPQVGQGQLEKIAAFERTLTPRLTPKPNEKTELDHERTAKS